MRVASVAVLGLAVWSIQAAGGEWPAPGGKVVAITFPAYGADQKRAATGGTVRVEFSVDAEGFPFDVHVVSGPSGFDGAVLAAVREWMFMPPYCVHGSEEPYRGGLTVAFEVNDGRYFVTVKDQAYTSSVAPSDPSRAGPDPRRGDLHRVAGVDPVIPGRALRAAVREASAVAAFVVDADGAVAGNVRVFTRPRKVYVDEVKEAVATWRFDPPRDAQDRPTRAIACAEVPFAR